MMQEYGSDVIDAGLCAKRFRHYVQRAWNEIDPSPFIANWHVDAICDHLQACFDGQIQKLIINVPPGTAKSMLCGVMFPSWAWIRRPSWQFLSASYEQGLATRDAVKARELMKGEWYTRWFRGPNAPYDFTPWEFSGDQDNKTDYKNTAMGRRMALGVGGKGTGYRGDCLAGDTLISTENGLLSIRELCATPNPPKVWSVSSSGVVELATIKATSVRFSRARRIDTISGASVTCTDGHRFYSGDSYVRSEDIRKGDTLIRDVRNPMPRVSDTFRAPSVRGSEAQRPDVLFAPMCDGLHQQTIRQGQDLPDLQGPRVQEQSSAVEFRGLLLDCLRSTEGETLSRTRGVVSLLSERVPSTIVASSTLFQRMCEQDTQSRDGWSGQLTLQGGQQLRGMVSTDAPAYSRAGWLAVCELQSTANDKHGSLAGQAHTTHESYNSPHQPQATRQSSREPSDLVCDVSHRPPQVEEDTVALVGRLGDSFQPMYDIELDRNHNFFANSILVHNCLIIDDPLNAKDAHSEIKRETCIRWKDETMSSRFNVKEKAVEILIMQRLHENDLTGHLLRKGGWEHLSLPAEYECAKRARTKLLYKGKPWEDPRKEEGELLFPALLSKPVLDGLKKDLGSYAYAGQYQQRPVPAGGGVLKRHWFNRRWLLPDQPPVEGFECRPVPIQFDHISVWTDAAFKKTEDSDRVAIGVFGVKGPDLYLLHLVWDRMGFNETVAHLMNIRNTWPMLHGIYIEDKANGSAIIETLRAKIAGVIPVEPDGGKESRINAVAPFIESGNLWLPLSSAWVEDYVVEACSFPKAPHDDAIDMTAYALTHYCAKRYSTILEALTRD